MTQTLRSAPSTHALLTDGRTLEVRPSRPEDHAGVLAMYRQLSAESTRRRFFGVSARSAALAAERACRSETSGHLALLALHDGRTVGVAEYEIQNELDDQIGEMVTDSGAVTAEVSLAVADDLHHVGVGTLLLEHLVHAARQAGVTTLTAVALADNHPVLGMFRDLGLRVTRRPAGTEVYCTVSLASDEEYLTACDERARIADLASLRPLLRPGSLAVIGASRRPDSVGRAVLRSVRRGGFAGRLYAVNPHAKVIERTPTYPEVDALPCVPDVAVIAVPAAGVPEVAEDCGRAGVRALVVVSSGLDAGQGAALLGSCRAHGMRLVGPNCLGIANTEESVTLDATFAAATPARGGAGVAVQSGGVGIALLGGLSRLGIGVSSFASLGDKYDVSGNDLLRWWEADGTTGMAVLHLESFGNPRAFSRTARRVARRMPVLTVDAGRSDAGRRAAASHTAAAATPTMTRRALFTQAGVIATNTVAELLDAAALLHTQPLPAGSRVAVLSNAGGAGVLAADALVEAGLTVPELPVDLVADLLHVLPPGSSVGNPVDTTAAVSGAVLRACLDRLAAHDSVDAVIVVLVPTAIAAATGDDPVRALVDPHRDGGNTPVAVVRLDQGEHVRLLPGPAGDLPCYGDPQDAARALAHAAERARWLSRWTGAVPTLSGIDAPAARALVDAYLDAHPDGGWLEPRECAELLGHYGIPLVPWAWAATEDEAVAAAARVAGPDGPVVLKAHWPGLVHKSDQGAVALDLKGEEQVRDAYRRFAGRFGDRMTGVLVQAMARRGAELFAGVVQDDVFGPLIVFGLGGTATELLADHAARLAPLTDQDVRDLIGTPRCAPLLFGYRGDPPADLAALEGLLSRLSRLACDLPQLAEADLNPVVARHDGILALDARIRLLPGTATDPHLRRLR
ncbi:GNAT family N-acetyltransferase [Streptomyces sp. B6B3]|uniref:bifunctional acetate--CoA ligase family protein/GNAT family N-acetyltransferase n=1 Tax=Streptomyces sp. B6B3 TaxID=3153570 RepID=UPI00325F1402